MVYECIEVSIEVHSFRLAFLLVHIRHPDQWGAPPSERLVNLRDEEMRNQTREEASRPKDKQVRVVNGFKGTRRRSDGSHLKRDPFNAPRSCERCLTEDTDTGARAPTEAQRVSGCRDHSPTHVKDPMNALDTAFEITPLLGNRGCQ